MKMNRKMKKKTIVALLAMAFVACQDGTSPTDGDFGGANFDLQHGGNGGNEDFFFMPPLTSSPKGNKVGDRPALAGLSPRAKMCQLNDGDEAGSPNPSPTLQCVDNGGVNDGQVADLPMTFDDVAGFYQVNWNTGDSEQGAPLSTAHYYRIEVFVGQYSLGFRDVDPDPGPPSGACKTEAFCQFNNGANLSIKTIIESFAVCIALDPTFDPATDLCATQNVDPGGSLQLGNLAKATVDENSEGGVVNMQPCQDLFTRGGDLDDADIGRVDIPTFGDCVEINDLGGVGIFGTATMCDAFDDAQNNGGLTAAQAGRLTVHRFSGQDGFTVGLPHSEGVSGCAEQAGSASLELDTWDRVVRFARNAWNAVNDQMAAWFQPAPLHARAMMFRCNRESCSSPDTFRSSYQVARPSVMGFGNGPDLGDQSVNSDVVAQVQVVDEEGDPVEGARLTFKVKSGGGAAPAAPVLTNALGIAEATLTLGSSPGLNEWTVQGIGIGTAATGIFAPGQDDAANAEPVPLGTPELTFFANGLVTLSFASLPDRNLFVGEPFTVVVCGADPGQPLLVTLGAFNNNGEPEALMNVDPDPVNGPFDDPEGTVSDFTDGGCVEFNVYETKPGGVRLIASADGAVSIVSSRFNFKNPK